MLPIATIAQLTEALNLNDNQMSVAVATETITAQVGTIDPNTGCMFTTDDAAQARAAGPDRPDLPRNPWVGRSFTLQPPIGFPPPRHPVF